MKVDLVVIGSGFGGALTALIARQIGLSVLLVEKNSHPRFIIGESTTPLTNLYLENLCDRYDLPEVKKLSKWGTWQQSYPSVPVGLKRGFSFFHHDWDKPFYDDETHRNQLLVAANPHERLGDTHWYRPGFDKLLVEMAQQQGVEYRDHTNVSELEFSDDIRLILEQEGKRENVIARFLVDASGPRGFLFRELNLREMKIPNIPVRQGLYNHFRQVGSTLDWIHPEQQQSLPYNPDYSAIHHLFDGGWIWMLRFNNGVVSAGVSLEKNKAQKLKLWEGESAWTRLIKHLPSVSELFWKAKSVYEFRYVPDMSFQSETIAGKNWVMLPSAAGFIDPLMSTGFPLNLRGISRLGGIFEHLKDHSLSKELLDEYHSKTQIELDLSALMIAALYVHFNDFELFAAISMLYFAAASYSESAIRLSRPDLSASFLLDEDPVMGQKLRSCYEKALSIKSETQRKELIDEIYEAVKMIDVAGLSDRHKKNWYPVDADDMLENAAKLKCSRQFIQNYLIHSGFYVEK